MVVTPDISIIVPVYNTRPFLEKCVKSILHQTFKNFEIILVDDGSTDSSGLVCDQFKSLDTRVTVIHKSNGGLSDARNNGIAMATAPLLTFIDSDDFIGKHYLEYLIKPFKEYNVDLSVVNFQTVSWGEEIRETPASTEAPELKSNFDALESLFLQRGVTTSAWGKLYRASAFKGISYPVGYIHEDLPVTYRLFQRANTVAFIDSNQYYYVQRPKSITSSADYKRRLPALDFASKAIKDMEQVSPELMAAAEVRFFMENIYLLSQIPSFEELRPYKRQLCGNLSTYRLKVLASRAPIKQKLWALLSFLPVKLLRFIAYSK